MVFRDSIMENDSGKRNMEDPDLILDTSGGGCLATPILNFFFFSKLP